MRSGAIPLRMDEGSVATFHAKYDKCVRKQLRRKKTPKHPSFKSWFTAWQNPDSIISAALAAWHLLDTLSHHLLTVAKFDVVETFATPLPSCGCLDGHVKDFWKCFRSSCIRQDVSICVWS